ncbi:MAG: SAM-dependent methyltransferase [Clostridiales bacterium]|nr:SAM-dependent methyltransferase [Clostridiales bacterium]
MTKFEKIQSLLTEQVIMISFGNSKIPGLTRARIRPINDDKTQFFQLEKIIDKKAFHENITAEDLPEVIVNYLSEDFKNAVIYTHSADFYIRRTKKDSLNIMKRPATKYDVSIKSHNIEKNYIISEGTIVPFLIELGIMNDEGQVRKKHYSKFRQINRFLELVEDESKIWKDSSVIKIYDLCCGKGYLTLALHYYFSTLKGINTQIEGMDLKEDVISYLNSLVSKLKLEGINFVHGDIQKAKLNNPDIVVALHACDIATDIALTSAVSAGAKLIMAVPCCQHELFHQIENNQLAPILKYGIMKDKFTELSTNALRGLALEAQGYDVRMIEFTSLEHTMKNIMIKAISGLNKNINAYNEFFEFSKNLNVDSSSKRIINAEKKSD